MRSVEGAFITHGLRSVYGQFHKQIFKPLGKQITCSFKVLVVQVRFSLKYQGLTLGVDCCRLFLKPNGLRVNLMTNIN